MLRAPDSEARALAAALVAVRDEIVYCATCFNITDQPICSICLDGGRDDSRLCVVEEPLDVLALERTGAFRGRYHVLHGAISPMDGIGPDRLKVRELLDRTAARAREGAPYCGGGPWLARSSSAGVCTTGWPAHDRQSARS